jgi:hypothetical protein
MLTSTVYIITNSNLVIINLISTQYNTSVEPLILRDSFNATFQEYPPPQAFTIHEMSSCHWLQL